MIRLDNWRELLADHIATVYGVDFSWGAFDCATFVGDCVLAMTGVDIVSAIRGTYSTESEADVAMVAMAAGGAGNSEIEAAAIAVANASTMPDIPLSWAGPGDVVLVWSPDVPSLGVIDLDGRFALCASTTGLTRVAQRRWMRAWSVPISFAFGWSITGGVRAAGSADYVLPA